MTQENIQTLRLEKGSFDTMLLAGGNGDIFFSLVTDVKKEVFAITFPGINKNRAQGDEYLDDTIVINNKTIANLFFHYSTTRKASSSKDLYDKTLEGIEKYLTKIDEIDEIDNPITE